MNTDSEHNSESRWQRYYTVGSRSDDQRPGWPITDWMPSRTDSDIDYFRSSLESELIGRIEQENDRGSPLRIVVGPPWERSLSPSR